MLHNRLILAALLSSLLYVACSTERSVAPPPSPALHTAAGAEPSSTALHTARAPITLSVLGINDLHGRIRALPAFAGYVSNVRRARALDHGAVALVDAGDMFQGTLESNLTEGASVIAAYEVLGMTVATLGNHEFDFGPVGDDPNGDPQGAIRARIGEASFPILSANLVVKGSHESPHWNKLLRSAVVDVGSVRVGFVGLLTYETPSIVRKAFFEGLAVDGLAPALLREAQLLRQKGATVVIGVAHAGADCKDFGVPTELGSCSQDAEIFDVARALPPGTVDAIFAGHTHAGVAQLVNGVPIVEAYAYGRAFSRIDLVLDGTTQQVLQTKVFPPQPLCPLLGEGQSCVLADYEGAPTVEAPQITAVIAPALALAQQRREAPLGCNISEMMSCEHGSESALGNLFADMLKEAVTSADVAILNGGSLRANLPAGELSYGELFEAMPFDNLVARIRLTGAELKRVISTHLQHDAHGLISLSGIRVSARCGPKGAEIKLVRDNGRAVSDRETLLVATSDYLAAGGDSLFQPLQLNPARIDIDTSRTFRDALASSLEQHPQLSPRDPAIFNPARPRIEMSTPRPLICPH